MRNIDVGDLPEPYVRAVNTIVETFRRELATREATPKVPTRPVKLSLREGKVIGDLSREEIHDDVR